MSNIILKLSFNYLITKLKYPSLSDNKLFIQLFFKYYIPSLINEIQEKYGVDLTLDFKNYEDVYLFLDEKNSKL